jgi:hypothetical protein
MRKKFSFWLWATVICQLLSAAIHSLSFFLDSEPANDSERQLDTLMTTYKINAGAGFHPTMMGLFNALSIGFLLLCVLGGLLNLYLWKKKIPMDIMKGVVGINCIVFGVCFCFMAALTFLIPIVSTGLIFISCAGAYTNARTIKVQ